MLSSIAYILFSALGIAVLTGIIIIVRNSIRITTTYNFLKNKLKSKNRLQRLDKNLLQTTDVSNFQNYKSEEISTLLN